MPTFETKRRVGHTAAEMLALVADVERYPEFVPLCEALRVEERSQEGEVDVLTAEMTVGYKAIRERFTTRVRIDRPGHRIVVAYLDGPFRHLENVWRFSDLGAGESMIDFHIDYEFRSRLFQALAGAVFDRVYRKMVEAFETRADVVYGRNRLGVVGGV
jgi:coenzyme Q-binding protein COQ10